MRFKRPEEYTGQEYAKLPEGFVRKLRERWRQDARAATPNGAPFPLRSWPPDAAIDIQNLAEWADRYSYPTASARNADIPSPYLGQITYLQDTGTVQAWNGYVWVGDTAWQTPSAMAGWSVGSAQYRMNHQAQVSVRGAFAGSSPSVNQIWTMPVNYRAGTIYAVGQILEGGTTKVGLFQIYSSGILAVIAGYTTLTSVTEARCLFTWQADFKAVR